MHGVDHETVAGCADGVAERDPAAVDVDHVVGESELGLRAGDDGAERLVDLHHVEVGGGDPGLLACLCESAGGLLVQFMPHSVDRLRAADLHPGDAPQGHEILAGSDPDGISDDAWAEARSLVETIEDHELLDPLLESERLLYRLFHERGARVFDPVLVREDCRCSRERVLGMLRGFTAEDRKAMVADDGTLGVTCEFCSRRYSFEASEVEAGLSEGA